MHIKKIFVSENQQTIYLIKVVAFFWLITKIWSYKTWIADRRYPLIPPSDVLKYIPDFLHLFLFGLSLLTLLIILLIKKNRILLIVLFSSELLSCSLDMVRWQPWEYMYMCMLLIVIINFHKPKNILLLIHLFLVSMYLFSGLHKFNRGFLSSVWLNTALINFFGVPMGFILKYKLFFVGLLIPIVEVVSAVLLFISKSKKKISYFLIFIHISILIFIGPFGLKYNSVVWFWNLALIFILIVIYAEPIKRLDKNMFVGNWYWLGLWFLMPLFTFFGYRYQYFSFSLYSGKGDQMYICISENNNELRPYFEHGVNRFCEGTSYINLQNWALEEIKSAPIPETEIYKKIAAYIRWKYPDNKMKIILYNPQTQKIVEL